MDLKQDNPYLIDGLKYPLPERLTPTKKSNYGKGTISKKGKASYHIYHGGKKVISIFVLVGLMSKLIILLKGCRNVTLINHRCLVYKLSILNGTLG